MRTSILAAASVASVASCSFGTVLIGPVFNPGTLHNYYLLSLNTWTASQTEAVGLSGNLATINDAAENAWVFSTFGSSVPQQYGLWIGYNDAATEGTWVWVSGETPSYTNWGGTEPNNSGAGGQDYAEISSVFDAGISPGQWGDLSDPQYVAGLYGVVEVVPEPTSLAATSIGLIVLRRRNRGSK